MQAQYSGLQPKFCDDSRAVTFPDAFENQSLLGSAWNRGTEARIHADDISDGAFSNTCPDVEIIGTKLVRGASARHATLRLSWLSPHNG
jgi:hypothetical protein